MPLEKFSRYLLRVTDLPDGKYEILVDGKALGIVEAKALAQGVNLNALLLDHIDTDLARMRVLNEILADGEKAYGPDFLERINEVAGRERGQQFRHIDDVVIRPSADLGRLAGQILRNISGTRGRSPLLRLAARNLAGDRRGQESDLLSYLLFDGEFLAPLAELGFSDARSREEELCRFFTD